MVQANSCPGTRRPPTAPVTQRAHAVTDGPGVSSSLSSGTGLGEAASGEETGGVLEVGVVAGGVLGVGVAAESCQGWRCSRPRQNLPPPHCQFVPEM
jgi:hypothetical protein